MDHCNTIAWLIPSAGNQRALEAVQMTENLPRLVTSAASPRGLGIALDAISENLPPPSLSGLEEWNRDLVHETRQCPNPTEMALKLTFDNGPKGEHGFIFGTDAEVCDIVLPNLPGVSRQHCYISFDDQQRLILKDISRRGTAVWYDGSSTGDRPQGSWMLGNGGTSGFPERVKKIVLDIQSIRFQIVVKEPSADLEAYTRRVDDFLKATTARQESTIASLVDLDPQPVFIKYRLAVEDGLPPDTYLWNLSRPWEPMVKVVG
jgi:hypothetical protein